MQTLELMVIAKWLTGAVSVEEIAQQVKVDPSWIWLGVALIAAELGPACFESAPHLARERFTPHPRGAKPWHVQALAHWGSTYLAWKEEGPDKPGIRLPDTSPTKWRKALTQRLREYGAAPSFPRTLRAKGERYER